MTSQQGSARIDAVGDGQRQAQERTEQKAKDHKETFDENVGRHKKDVLEYRAENKANEFITEFMSYDLKTIKSMVADGDRYKGVKGIAEAWDSVHDQLVGGGGDTGGGAYGELKRAVENVLEYWNGDSADRFKAEAERLLGQISNGASHCTTVAKALRGAANDYRETHLAVKDIEEPNWFDKTVDFIDDMGDRDSKLTDEAIKNRDIPKDLLAKADEGYLGAEKEAKLRAANHMETLARNYVQYAKNMDSSRPYNPPGESGETNSIPPSQSTVPMPTPVPVAPPSSSAPSSAAKRSAGGVAAPPMQGPRDSGISGGLAGPGAKTKIDSLPAGITGSGADDVGGVRGSASPGGSGAAGGSTGGLGGGGGMLGGAAGGAASGAGAGARAGMGGGAGAGAGRGGAAAAGGRGALARAKGGTLGAPRGITGAAPATQGGTGLGRGRGSAATSGGRPSAGMLGGGRHTSQRPGDEGHEDGSRPDYLVEDEATWVPEDRRNVPKTIE